MLSVWNLSSEAATPLRIAAKVPDAPSSSRLKNLEPVSKLVSKYDYSIVHTTGLIYRTYLAVYSAAWHQALFLVCI